MIDKKLLEILACPACRGDIAEEDGFIVCHGCQNRYPIKDDIPVMLIDEAVKHEEKGNDKKK